VEPRLQLVECELRASQTKNVAENVLPRFYAEMTAEIQFRGMNFTMGHFDFHITIIGWIIIGIAALVALFFVTFVIICLWERRYLVGDVEPAKEPFPYTATRYWIFTRQDALKLGWLHAGDYSTKKTTTLVKGMQSLFISPDGTVIAGICSGSTAGAKLHKTVLRSRLDDGRILETSDIAVSQDPTDLPSQAVLMNAGIVELFSLHAQRLQKSGATPVPFTLPNALKEYETIDWERGERSVQQGLAKWAEPEKISTRMTLRGALVQVKLMIARGRAMNEQTHRIHILRAGSRPSDQQS